MAWPDRFLPETHGRHRAAVVSKEDADGVLGELEGRSYSVVPKNILSNYCSYSRNYRDSGSPKLARLVGSREKDEGCVGS